jgi:hypothetical protein
VGKQTEDIQGSDENTGKNSLNAFSIVNIVIAIINGVFAGRLLDTAHSLLEKPTILIRQRWDLQNT